MILLQNQFWDFLGFFFSTNLILTNFLWLKPLKLNALGMGKRLLVA